MQVVLVYNQIFCPHNSKCICRVNRIVIFHASLYVIWYRLCIVYWSYLCYKSAKKYVRRRPEKAPWALHISYPSLKSLPITFYIDIYEHQLTNLYLCIIFVGVDNLTESRIYLSHKKRKRGGGQKSEDIAPRHLLFSMFLWWGTWRKDQVQNIYGNEKERMPPPGSHWAL